MVRSVRESAVPVGVPVEIIDPDAGYRRWASILFAVLLAVDVIAGFLVLASGVTTDAVVLPLLVQVVAVAALFVVLLVGLRDRRPWAIAAIAPICLILLVFGVIRVVLALDAGEITIPLEAVGAAMVLSRRPTDRLGSALSPRDSWIMVAIVTAALAMTLWPIVSAL
jgi:hypothetical protein